MTTIHQHVACTVCGCVCDDLKLTVEGERIVHAENACELAEWWYLRQNSVQRAAASVEGEDVSIDEALVRAAEILKASRAPLIYGLSRSSTEGQRAAVRLADVIGATIDTTASMCHAPSIMAIQQVGESTCTLGEVSNRADLVIYWGCNPVISHPRHLERYSLQPHGLFVDGAEQRRLVVIDTVHTKTADLADSFILLPPERDYETIAALRGLLRGLDVSTAAASAGLPIEDLQTLVDWMKGCQSGVVFFGLGLARPVIGHRNVEALLRLVSELNAYSPFYARRMRIPGDVTGADSVLCWQTGFPFAVNLHRGYPRYNPGEFSGEELLARQEVDACLFVGSEALKQFISPAVNHLLQIPMIHLDYPEEEPRLMPTVRFTTAVYGVHAKGTVYRMDEVPLPVPAVLPRTYPTDDEILTRLTNLILASGGA